MSVPAAEYQGVRVCTLPSLSASDAWHASKGYAGVRSSEAYIFHPEQGCIGSVSFNVL